MRPWDNFKGWLFSWIEPDSLAFRLLFWRRANARDWAIQFLWQWNRDNPDHPGAPGYW